MFTDAHRLRHKGDIEKVMKSKKSVFDAACGVKFVKSSEDVSRFAVVVSTRVSKKAVDRNRMRRQYREIVQKILPALSPGYDIILLVSKPALELDFSVKEKKLRYVFQKAGLLTR